MALGTGARLRTDPDEQLSIEEIETREKVRRARHRSYDRIASVLYPVAAMVGAILVWEVGVRVAGVPTFLAPPPSHVAGTIVEHAPLILKNTWVTTVEILLGYFTSIVIGVPLALGISCGRRSRASCSRS